MSGSRWKASQNEPRVSDKRVKKKDGVSMKSNLFEIGGEQPSTSGFSNAAERPETVPLLWPLPETIVPETGTDLYPVHSVSSDGNSRLTGFSSQSQPLIWPLPQINFQDNTVLQKLPQHDAVTDNPTNLESIPGGRYDTPFMLGLDVSPVNRLITVPQPLSSNCK